MQVVTDLQITNKIYTDNVISIAEQPSQFTIASASILPASTEAEYKVSADLRIGTTFSEPETGIQVLSHVFETYYYMGNFQWYLPAMETANLYHDSNASVIMLCTISRKDKTFQSHLFKMTLRNVILMHKR